MGNRTKMKEEEINQAFGSMGKESKGITNISIC
jgi:hypothetical protein